MVPRRTRRPNVLRSSAVRIALGAVLALATFLPAAAASPAPSAGAVGTVFVNVSATSQLGFSPSAFTVPPGASVHLTVTQLSNFPHTFTLSSVANTTIPPSDNASELSDYFAAHPPLVNLSMGSAPNTPYAVVFTAPAAGTYEFVCLYHFSNGMVGTMTSGTSASAGSSGALPTEYLILAVVAVLIVVAAVVLVLRRRPPAKAPSAPMAPSVGPPKTP